MNRLLRLAADAVIHPSILFESKPAFSDNTKAVYDEMVRRGFDRKYNLIWVLPDNTCARIQRGQISYFDPSKRKTLSQKLLNYSFFFRTKCIICCNRFIPSTGEKSITDSEQQLSFYLGHGMTMKSVRGYYTCPDGIDYMLSPSPNVTETMAYEYKMPVDKMFALGYPRNDVFAQKPINLKDRIGGGYKRIIVWYPTVRQSQGGGIKLEGDSYPLIHDGKNAVALNETAKKNNVLILFKPHFIQKIPELQNQQLSNIKFIDDSFFEEMGFSSYEMLAASDALITDYSSVYFDYLLHDKPIGVVWEDIELYRNNPGFAIDLDYYLKGAEKIYSIQELCSFVEAVANEKDCLQNERREICDIVNYSRDGKNTARVVDYIVEKAQL